MTWKEGMKVMTNIPENPWVHMSVDTKRRIDVNKRCNIFWITDIEGRYGFYLDDPSINNTQEPNISLKGITLISTKSGPTGLFLLLNSIDDWPLFLIVCSDLINLINSSRQDDVLPLVYERLRRWQLFLTQNTKATLSSELQSGLFSELTVLKEVLLVRKKAFEAITAWIGPDFDKQDFAFPELMLEVKSYRTSKGRSVIISSPQQLYSPDKPLFLVANGLTESPQGKTVSDLAAEIAEILVGTIPDVRDIFEFKLISYGLMPGLQNSQLIRFVSDRIRFYQITEDFPKILPSAVPYAVSSLKYTLDLTRCDEFLTKEEAVFS